MLPSEGRAHRAACLHQSCSVFYTKRFCIDCVRSNLDEFPKEIQQVCHYYPAHTMNFSIYFGLLHRKCPNLEQIELAMDLTAAATLFLALLVGVQSQHSSGKRMLLQQLNLLAYRGDLEGVRMLFREHRSSLLEALSGEERTPVHYALQGRHESLSHQSTSLPGRHEEVVSFLIHTAGVGADQGCPLYYALHYRNMKVLETLLGNADMERYHADMSDPVTCHDLSFPLARSLPCLTSLDSTGRTALHAAVRSKASGFARFFSKLRHKKPDPTVLELLGLCPLEVHTHNHL